MNKVVLMLLSFAMLISCSKPVADFMINSDQLKAPAQIELLNKSEGATDYEWVFGDGSGSQDESPNHKYYLSGKYTIVLKASKGNKSKSKSKEIVIEAPDKCLVEIETEYGSMLVELFDETPKHRDNFVKLSEQGFYDDLLFHRVINGFMIQGGDPNSKNAGPNMPLGSGGPGYQIDAEITDNIVHVKGALAAARTGDAVNPERKSSGSQFYIVHGKPVDENMLSNIEMRSGTSYTDIERSLYKDASGVPFLDKQYTVFGRVIKGLEVIDKIAAVQTNQRDRPLEDVKMKIRAIK